MKTNARMPSLIRRIFLFFAESLKRDADTLAPAKVVVTNELHQRGSVVNPAMHENLRSLAGIFTGNNTSQQEDIEMVQINHSPVMHEYFSSLSGNFTGIGDSNNTNQQEGIEIVQELFDSNVTSIVIEPFRAVPMESTPSTSTLSTSDLSTSCRMLRK